MKKLLLVILTSICLVGCNDGSSEETLEQEQAQPALKNGEFDKELAEANKEQYHSLENFEEWIYMEPDKTIPITLGGTSGSILLGLDHPNGVKARILTDGDNMYPLDLYSDPSINHSPFVEWGELAPNFNLYATGHDFDFDGTDEVIVAASNMLTDTFIWVYSYNKDNVDDPAQKVFYGEGQSELILEGNKLIIPDGSQGLVEEYVYSNQEFIKQ